MRSPWKIGAAVAALGLIALSAVTVHELPSRAMENEFHRGNRLLVNRLAYGVRPPLTGGYVFAVSKPKRGDVVLVDSPDGGRTLKRIVALPGERVALDDGRLVIDGKPLDDRWLTREPGDVVEGFPETEVPDGRFFLMGDRRGRSRDSREYGAVPLDAIVGRASLSLPRGSG